MILNTPKKYFYPSFLFKEIVVMMLIFILVAIVLALVFPVGLGDPADPTDNLFVPKPEWYFMSLYELLSFSPGKLEVIATAIIPGRRHSGSFPGTVSRPEPRKNDQAKDRLRWF